MFDYTYVCMYTKDSSTLGGGIMEGKSALTINLPVSLKQSLKEQATKEGLTMTELVCKWIRENESTK